MFKWLSCSVCFILCTIQANLACAAELTQKGDLASFLDDFIVGPLQEADVLIKNAAYAIGIILLVAGVYKFQRFRENSRETTLSTVIMYLVLGLLTLGFAITHDLMRLISYA